MSDNMQKPNLNKPAFKIFKEEAHVINEGSCPFCKKPIHKEDFKDNLSIKEFSISGLCQECQDKTFG